MLFADLFTMWILPAQLSWVKPSVVFAGLDADYWRNRSCPGNREYEASTSNRGCSWLLQVGLARLCSWKKILKLTFDSSPLTLLAFNLGKLGQVIRSFPRLDDLENSYFAGCWDASSALPEDALRIMWPSQGTLNWLGQILKYLSAILTCSPPLERFQLNAFIEFDKLLLAPFCARA